MNMKNLIPVFAAFCAVCLAEGVDAQKAKETSLKKAKNQEVREMRQKWFDATEGNNLALGIKYELSPKPDYRLTTDDNDTSDMTDGLLVNASDDRLWFYRAAVGWYEGDGHSCIKLDLGDIKQVDRAVIRLLGGSDGNFKFPRVLMVHVSKDGKIFHPAGALHKLQPCESNLCDWKTSYYIEENIPWGQAWTYPFQVEVQADARYVIIEIEAESGSIFSDELAIMEATEKGENYNAAYGKAGKEFPMEGLIVRPRVQELAIMAGLPAPQVVQITDMREGRDPKAAIGSFVLELPQGVKVINEDICKVEALPDGGSKCTFEIKKKLPFGKTVKSDVFFLSAEAGTTGNAVVYGVSDGVEQFRTTLPLKILVPPEMEPFERLHVSLSWMGEEDGRRWPDFFNNWRRLGFNVVSSFPRYWWNAKSIEAGQKYVQAAHDAGFPVIMNDSSFHMMTGGKKAGHEIYCQIPGKEHTWLCPSYRGEFYKKEMERVRNCVKNGKPDYVFYDIEIWHNAKQSSKDCTRCQEAIKQSGLSQQEFLYKCGKETMADLKAAVELGAKDADIPVPQIGSYGRRADKEAYAIELWKDIYPDSVDMSQPSLYVCGRAQDVHDCIRTQYNTLKNKKTIPWLTTGTYGEFDSYKVEQLVLEALLNGSMGITYFQASDFYDSPLDFYYHAKALAELRPYENLIADGIVSDANGDNKDLTYTMVKKDGEMLLLVGNYKGANPQVKVSLPFKPGSIRDLRQNSELPAVQNFAFEVPKNEVRLFYIKD